MPHSTPPGKSCGADLDVVPVVAGRVTRSQTACNALTRTDRRALRRQLVKAVRKDLKKQCDDTQKQAQETMAGGKSRVPPGLANVLRVIENFGLLDETDGGSWRRDDNQKQMTRSYIASMANYLLGDDLAECATMVMEMLGVDRFSSETLVVTARQFGKTSAMAMTTAVVLVSIPSAHLAIYSTCKRISKWMSDQVHFFIQRIIEVQRHYNLEVLKHNDEGVILRNTKDYKDVRKVNAYPAKLQVSFAAAGRALGEGSVVHSLLVPSTCRLVCLCKLVLGKKARHGVVSKKGERVPACRCNGERQHHPEEMVVLRRRHRCLVYCGDIWVTSQTARRRQATHLSRRRARHRHLCRGTGRFRAGLIAGGHCRQLARAR